MLEDEGLVERSVVGDYRVTSQGYKAVEAMKGVAEESPKAATKAGIGFRIP